MSENDKIDDENIYFKLKSGEILREKLDLKFHEYGCRGRKNKNQFNDVASKHRVSKLEGIIWNI